MILLKTLTIKNFLSHEDTTLEFNETDKLLISGHSGSGKTAITEAILWTLYGKGRSENRSLVRRGTKEAKCFLKLIDEETQYVITRSVTSSGKNTLIITQNKGQKGQFLLIDRVGLKDNQDWIEKELLKASYELFINSVAYTQDGDESFVKATASRRKDLLLEIVRAENFDKLYDKTRVALNEKEREQTVFMTRVEGFETAIKNDSETALKHDSYQKTYEEMTTQLKSFELLEKDLDFQLNSISQTRQQITDKKVIKQMLITEASLLEVELNALQKALKEHKEFDIETTKKGAYEIIDLTHEIGKLEDNLKDNVMAQQNINAHLSDKPSVFDYSKDIEIINNRLIPLIKDTGKCPSGDDCPFVVPIQGQIDFLTEQITEKTEKAEAEKELLKKWEDEFSLLPVAKDTTEIYKKIKELKEKIDILSKTKTDIEEYEAFEKNLKEMNEKIVTLDTNKNEKLKEILKAENQVMELEKTIATFDSNKINSDLSSVRLSKQQAQTFKEEASVGMAMAIKAQASVQEATKDLIILKNDIKKVQEEKENLELLKESLSPRGIKAVIIDYLVPQLEDRINEILSQMSDFRIRLDTQKATANEEGTKEGLWITVKNDQNEEMSFENYSGGEKNRIIIAIAEGLASLTSAIGFRIMDEMIVGLNSEMISDFITVLIKLQEKYPQIIFISHIPECKEVFEKVLTVKKLRGISKVV